MIRILVTGGTFDKKYDELSGRLFFRETHVPEMLRLGRSRLDVTVDTAMDNLASEMERQGFAARGIPLLIGGQPELAAPRAARWGAGFTLGGAPPSMAGGAIDEFTKAWTEAGATWSSTGTAAARKNRRARSRSPAGAGR